jgi:hypothetical protein
MGSWVSDRLHIGPHVLAVQTAPPPVEYQRIDHGRLVSVLADRGDAMEPPDIEYLILRRSSRT